MNGKDIDPLEYLARVAGATVQECEKVGAPVEAQCDAERLQVEMLALIEGEASKRQATSALGTLFQLVLAAGIVGELVGNDMDAHTLRKLQRIEGCLYSAINVLERECGLDRDAVGAAYYARRDYVPEIWCDYARASA